MKRILSIDGGGLYGLLPALVLAELERRAGRPTRELFDLAVGTSTGGIVAIATCGPRPMAAEDVARLYRQRAREIFNRGRAGRRAPRKPPPKDVLEGAFGAVHDPGPLEGILRTLTRDEPLDLAQKPVAVTAYDIVARAPRIIASWDRPALKAWEAARATAAAPIMFPPFGALIDGGVWACCPAAVGRMLARRLWPGDREAVVVALGTGDYPRPLDPKAAAGWGAVGWLKTIAGVVLDATTDGALLALAHDPATEVVRLQPFLTRSHADAADDPAALDRIAADGRDFIAAWSPLLDTLARRLAAPL